MATSKSRDVLVWTDDEVELLLKVTNEYKELHAAQNIDWELSQSKYNDIYKLYQERYPSPEEAKTMGKEYPRKKEEITKGQLSTKLKAIRIRCRQAMESGRKRGHGRVILLYFDLCMSIWAEPPATNAKAEGIASPETGSPPETGSSLETGSPPQTGSPPETGSPAETGSSPVPGGNRVAEGAVSTEMVANRPQRRDFIQGGYRRDKFKRKLSTEQSVAQEDLAIKRRLLQRLEATDDEFVQTMGRWSSTMDRLNSNIERLVQHIVGSGTNKALK